MHFPGRTIWDTRIQDVCAVLTAELNDESYLFATASFAQVTIDPPRIIVNPNRTYGIEEAVKVSGRFAVNVLPQASRWLMIELMRMRRRQHSKAQVLGIELSVDHHRTPFVANSIRTVFCEVEQVIDSGDRRLYVGRVIESRVNPKLAGELPLLFGQVTDQSKHLKAKRVVRTALVVSGGLDMLKGVKQKLRPAPPADIAATTYDMAGATEEEIAVILKGGTVDRSRAIRPPRAPAIITKQVGICVVGTVWGQTHARYLRMLGANVRLFMCGQNKEKTDRIARAFGADAAFYGLEQALADERVDAVTIAMPHHLHRFAVEQAAAAGKDILVEKPISTNLHDTDAMISAASKAGVMLMVAEDMHFRPAIREAVQLIERGAIGEPLYFLAHAGGVRRPSGWAADKALLGGGVLMDIGVHYIRALRLLMGEPDSVFASSAMQINTKMSGEDSAQLMFSSRYGWQAHLLTSWSSHRGHLPDIVVMGENGTIHLWPSVRYIDHYPVEPRLLTKLISYVRPYALQERLMKPTLQRVRIRLPDRDVTGYLGEMQEFVAAVGEGREPQTPAADGRRDVEIILSCYEALQEQKECLIPQITPSSPP